MPRKLYIAFFFLTLLSSCGLNDRRELPRLDRPPRIKATKSIIISIDKNNDMIIGENRAVRFFELDSVLRYMVDSMYPASEEPSVVINGDSAASYGNVFEIMQSAKRAGARVVTNVVSSEF
jgi:biopolymer transport protein ExbD